MDINTDASVRETQYGPQNNGDMHHQCPATEFLKTSVEAPEIPPYLPQPGDDLPVNPGDRMDETGPWATGRVNFTPKNGITGIRPVVDRYSITRFGPNEWRANNWRIFQESDEKIREAQFATNNAKQCVERAYNEVDKTQLETTDHLKNRANVVYHWKSELERAIIDITKEIELIEAERRRVKQSLLVLTVPESIAGEFLRLRANRLESDLIRDDVEEELTKEVALCSEIRDLLGRTREQIEMQLIELKSAKARMEIDWADKNQAYRIDSDCIKLTNDSPLLMWKPGATRFPADQSTPTSHEHFTKESLTQGGTVRQSSINLRSTLDAIYKNSIKDLRDQATRVDVALGTKIRLTEEVCHQLEKELLRCLHELANTEKTIQDLRDSVRGLNSAMKLAQTRLSNRLQRCNVESCRDVPQFALVDEVKSLNEKVTAALSELKRAEDAQAGLVKARRDLEQEITVKRKTLYVDKQRGQLLRSFYPSASALLGF